MNAVLNMNYERTILYQHVFVAIRLLFRLELADAVLFSYTLESDLTLCAWHCVQLMSQLPQAQSQPDLDECGLPPRVLSFQADLTCSNRLCGAALAEWLCCRSWAIHGLPCLMSGCRLRCPPDLDYLLGSSMRQLSLGYKLSGELSVPSSHCRHTICEILSWFTCLCAEFCSSFWQPWTCFGWRSK
jgi:hypothetical protein